MYKNKMIFLFSVIFLTAVIIFNGCFGGKKKNKNEITLLMWGRAEEIKAVDNFIKEFNKIYPDIKVRRIHTSQYYDKLQTMIAGGTPPDVLYMGSDYFPSYVKKDSLLDLTPYIENDPETNLPPFNIKDYFKETVKPFMFKGKYYGIPKDFTTMVLYYNKDIFDREGIKYPDANWTWNDFRKVAKSLTKDLNGDGRIDQYGFVFETWLGYWISWIWQNNGKIFDEKRGKYVIGKEPYLSRNVETLQFLYDLMYKYKVAPTIQETHDMGTSELFETGKIAMCTYGRWRTLELKNKRTFRWDVAVLPKNKKRASALFTVCYAIAKNSKHKLEAWKLLKFLVGKEGQISTAESCLAVPSLKSIALSKHFFEPQALSIKVNAKVFLDQLKYSYIMPATDYAPEVNDIINRNMDEIFVNKKPIKEVLIKIQNEIDKLYKSE